MSKSKLDRFIELFQDKKTWRVIDMANELGVSRQSIYRYCERIHSTLGIALDMNFKDDNGQLYKVDNLTRGYIRWPSNRSVQEEINIQLKREEYEALKTAVNELQHLTPLLQSAIDTLIKNKSITWYSNPEPVLYNPLVDKYYTTPKVKTTSTII